MSTHKHEFDFAGHCDCGMNYTSALEADRAALAAVVENMTILLHHAFAAACDGWPTFQARAKFTEDMVALFGTPSLMGGKLGLYLKKPSPPSDYHETYDLLARLRGEK